MILSQLNWIAVAVCTVIYFGIGAVWFSPLLFVNAWAKGHGINIPTSPEERAKARESMGKFMLITFIACLAGTIAIDYIETAMYAKNWMTGAKVGILGGVFVCIGIGLSHMHTKKSLATFMIDAGYHVASLLIVGIILSVWK